MGQYYNSKIETGIEEITKELNKKDEELSIMLGKELKKYAYTGEILSDDQMEKEFKKIYDDVYLGDVYKVFKKQLKNNNNSEQKIYKKKNEEQKTPEVFTENIEGVLNVFNEHIETLKKNSYKKYLQMIEIYKTEFERRFNDRL